MFRRGLFILSIGTIAATASTAAAQPAVTPPTRIFWVGNSLTVQQLYGGQLLNAVAAHAGRSQEMGYHFLGNSSLTNTTQTPLIYQPTGSFSPLPYSAALPTGTWSAVVLQPWSQSANSEIAAARSILSLLPNPATPAFVYATWPSRMTMENRWNLYAQPNIIEQWNAPYTDPSVPIGNTRSRAYFNAVLSGLRAQEPQRQIGYIPVGDVFAELEAQSFGDGLTTFTMSDLYADAIHATVLGRYTVALTQAAAIFGIDPRNQPVPAEFAGSVNGAQAAQIQNVVWSVVSSQAAYSGLTIPSPTAAGAALLAVVGLTGRRRRG